MTKFVINPEFDFLKNYLEEIPGRFDSRGILLHSYRNIIREDTAIGVRLVIKSFKRIYLPNKIRYSYFYPSKAQRAYDNANVLLKNGFDTPRPIAYIEIRVNGLIDEMFFVSEFTDFKSFQNIHQDPLIMTPTLLKAFAAFTFRLHQNKIYHVDYNLGNILTNLDHGEYKFSLIDNNRMKFTSIDFSDGVNNFARLGLSDEQMTVIGKEYGRLWKVDERVALKLLFDKKEAQARKHGRKKSLKRVLSVFKQRK